MVMDMHRLTSTTHMYGDHQAMFDAIHKIIKTAPIKGEGYWKNKGYMTTQTP